MGQIRGSPDMDMEIGKEKVCREGAGGARTNF